jgi:hypothetical protein
MKAGTWAALALTVTAAVATGGCETMRKLGFEEGKQVDGSKFMMRAGEDLNGMPGVKVTAIRMDPQAKSAEFTIRNDTGSPVLDLSLDVEFGFPAEPGSLADFNPHFEAQEVGEQFLANEEKTFVVRATGTFAKDPAYVRVHEAGQTSFTTAAREDERSGSRFVQGAVECVALSGDWNSAAPSLSFTLENVDPAGAPIGRLEYKVTFKKEGEEIRMPLLLRRFSAVEEEMGGAGSTVTVQVKGLDKVQGLSGSHPTIRVRAKAQ